jgi:hypothetical protein
MRSSGSYYCYYYFHYSYYSHSYFEITNTDTQNKVGAHVRRVISKIAKKRWGTHVLRVLSPQKRWGTHVLRVISEITKKTLVVRGTGEPEIITLLIPNVMRYNSISIV